MNIEFYIMENWNIQNLENLKESIVVFRNYFNKVEQITLNNPSKLNSITYEMSQLLYNRIKNFVDTKYKHEKLPYLIKEENSFDDEISKEEIIPKIVILDSSGEKSFCSGGSLSNLYQYKLKMDYAKLVSFYDYELSCDHLFYRMSPVLISIWEGYVMGGGVGISINSSIRIATENTVFAMPETSIGYFPDVGAAYFLTRIFNNEPSIGLFCGLIGFKLIGTNCVKAGAATHFVKKKNLQVLKEKLIEFALNAEDSEINLENIRKCIEPYCELVYSPENFFFENMELIKKTFLFDSLKDILERLEHLKSANDENERKWAKHLLGEINRMSPQACLIFFEYAKRALKFTDITEAYVNDWKLYAKLIHDSEFFEGIRAVIIDKDKNPKWNHKSLANIQNHEDLVQNFMD